MAEHGDPAHAKLYTIIHPTSPVHCTTLQLADLLENVAHQACDNPCEANGAAIVDCSNLIPNASTPSLYAVWITRVSTPSVFSVTCMGEHIQNQLRENGRKVIMSIFNDAGGYGKDGEALAAGTYMVVFKKIDFTKLHCLPISFSSGEKKAIKEYVFQCQSSAKLKKNENEQTPI